MEDYLGIAAFIGGIILFFVLLVMGANWVQNVSCHQSYSNYQPQYSLMSGCRIMWKGVLTPTDIVRTID